MQRLLRPLNLSEMSDSECQIWRAEIKQQRALLQKGARRDSILEEHIETSDEPAFDLASFCFRMVLSGIPRKAQQAILDYIEDINEPTIDRPSDEQELFIRRFLELVDGAIWHSSLYEGTRGIAQSLLWIVGSDIHPDDKMADDLLLELRGLAEVLSGIAT